MDTPDPSPSSSARRLPDPIKPSLRRSATTTSHRKLPPPSPSPRRVTLYLTSLRGVRRTFEDCRSVRSILRCIRVAVDERDLAMDHSYRRELQSLLPSRAVSLPQVFVGRRWIGGVDEIRRMHEDGDLAQALAGVSLEDPGGFVCHVCGGARFLPCHSCNGSRKVYVEDRELFRRCHVCNENGLVRCVDCY